jgi:hypothetical protein
MKEAHERQPESKATQDTTVCREKGVSVRVCGEGRKARNFVPRDLNCSSTVSVNRGRARL